jgi:galactose mutarotase-like enzyme
MNALILENRVIRAVIVPDMGGRILSLIYKPTETDFAWHNLNVPIGKPKKEIEFEDASGLFECFPTAEECTFKGRTLPGGGEVGFDPWNLHKIEKTPNSITVRMRITCKVYPFSIQKQISLNGTDPVVGLRIEIRNLSNESLEYHFTHHNTLQVSPNHRIVIPREVSKVKLGYTLTDRLGKVGDELTWPQTTDKDGNIVDVSRLGNATDGTAENLYTPKLTETWCALLNEAKGEAIGFNWSVESLPYLLIWISNGGWRNCYHTALEPSSGRPDNLDKAVNQWKDFAKLDAKGKIAWKEHIVLAHNVKQIERVEEDRIVDR